MNNTVAAGYWSTGLAVNLVRQGRGSTATTRGESITWAHVRFFFRLPDYQHSTELEPEPYSEHWLVVSPLIYMHLRGLGLIDVRRPVLQIPEDQIAPVESLFAELAEVPRGKQDYGMPEWQLFLQRAVALLACIQEHGQSDVDYPTGPRWMAAAVGLLKGNLAKNPSLEQIAANLGVHEQTLRKQFKAHMGVSPIAYRNNYRIEVARHELLTRSVADVAAFTGFQDTKHFARQFKLKTAIRRASTSNWGGARFHWAGPNSLCQSASGAVVVLR